jgi:hypothetical protein
MGGAGRGGEGSCMRKGREVHPKFEGGVLEAGGGPMKVRDWRGVRGGG